MANQTISVDTNHDTLTGRAAGEDITVNSGAKLTIDSMPHLTGSGILGDLLINDGEIHIDGTRTFEIDYSGGSGTLPSVGDAISWNGGTDTGKVIALNSGNNVAGVLTITKDVGVVTPDAADTLASGGWTADVDVVAVGYLIVYGENQVWDTANATCTKRITGDWYELGTGTGADSQVFTLPHNGVQWAVWVETGSGTGIFEIWHKLPTRETSAVFYNSLTEFGTTWENGGVFDQVLLASSITFGTSTNGGVVPSGARVRIPNVHIGTTTTGAPTTEVVSITATVHIDMVDSNTNENIFFDHFNGSTVGCRFIGTNAVTVSDSCWGNLRAGSLVNKVNASVTINNCYIGAGVGLTGDLPVSSHLITDNIGGITFNNCVLCAGLNSNSGGAVLLTTMANIDFTGTCKVVSNQKDENTMATVRGSVALNVYFENLVSLGGSVYTVAGCANWTIDNLIFGLPKGRGTTEENNNIFNALGTVGIDILAGRLQTGGAKVSTIGLFLITDCDQVNIRNFGEIDAKIDLANRATYVISLAGITTNVRLNRLWFDNINGASAYQMINSCADITIENCSGEYTDEIELDATRVLCKGLHGASGNLDAATGVEADLVNCLATVFLDYFKSDTTGALGLVFNDRGVKHLGDVTIVSGTPVWDGLGYLRMRTTGDQVIFEHPYTIKGHTAFQNIAVQLDGVNTGNLSYEYDIDTGSGYSGSWSTINGANLSGESISPSGFNFKIRVTCNTGASTNTLGGIGIRTNTTLADQEANFYPLDVVDLIIEGIPAGAEWRLYEDSGIPGQLGTVELDGQESKTGTDKTYQYEYSSDTDVVLQVIADGYEEYQSYFTLTVVAQTIKVNLTLEENL